MDIVLRGHESQWADKSIIAALATKGESTTILTDDEIVAIIGCYEMRAGVLLVWVLPSIYLPRCAKTVIKAVKRYLQDLRRTHHRIESCSVADPETDRWMEFLGFTCEGTLRQFTADKLDYKQWSIVEGDK